MRAKGTFEVRVGRLEAYNQAADAKITMTPTSQEATIAVVPGSGTGELEGIVGTMSIEIEDGRHFYDFEYTLPSSP